MDIEQLPQLGAIYVYETSKLPAHNPITHPQTLLASPVLCCKTVTAMLDGSILLVGGR
eukprot:c45092_g1_i1 orf=45-218(+)